MISVITPTYNRKEMLKDVINCLFMQTYSDWEMIIIDDCSTDGTKDMMEKYKDHPQIHYYINETNLKNPGLSRNIGFKKAKGDYVIFMDDDDYYTDPDFFKKAIECYNSHPDLNLCLVSANCHKEFINENNRKGAYSIGLNGHENGIEFLLNLDILYKKPLSTFTSVFTMKSLQEADLYNMQMVNDNAIYLRALLYGDIYVLEDIVGCYRIHSNNISDRIQKDFLIKNLDERFWVKEKLLTKDEPKKINKWWRHQMYVLERYYLFHSNPSFKDGHEVVSYILKHSESNLMFTLQNYIMLIMYRPYCLLKGK